MGYYEILLSHKRTLQWSLVIAIIVYCVVLMLRIILDVLVCIAVQEFSVATKT